MYFKIDDQIVTDYNIIANGFADHFESTYGSFSSTSTVLIL